MSILIFMVCCGGFLFLAVNVAYFGPELATIDTVLLVLGVVVGAIYIAKNVLKARRKQLLIQESRARFLRGGDAGDDKATVQRKLRAHEWLKEAENFHPGQARRMAPSKYALDLWLKTNKNANYVGPPRVYEDREALRELSKKTFEEARKAIEGRAIEKAKPDPRAAAERAWLENRKIPAPQQYGVSHQGAELLTAQWLHYLGQTEVSVTPFSSDGGVDVYTSRFAVQVKNYSQKPVGVSEVRELLGVAVSVSLSPLLFTATSLTSDALMFCEMNSISVLRFNVEFGTLDSITYSAKQVLADGKYQEL